MRRPASILVDLTAHKFRKVATLTRPCGVLLGLPLLQQASAEGFQTFSVSFDPRQVSPDQVKQILLADGAAIIPAP